MTRFLFMFFFFFFRLIVWIYATLGFEFKDILLLSWLHELAWDLRPTFYVAYN